MKKSASDVLDKIFSAKSENINNINYNQQQLTTSTTSIIFPNERDVGRSPSNSTPSAVLLASPSAGASLNSQSGSGRPAQVKIPNEWLGVKFDLFLNEAKKGKLQYKLVMSIINSQRKSVNLKASLNSPLRYMYYGCDMSNPFWQLVKQTQTELKTHNANLKGSKFYQNTKQGTLNNHAVFLYCENNCWTVTLIKDLKIYTFDLNGDCSEAFTKKNGIATAFYGSTGKTIKWIDPKDLGI
jgi:hypothetical protein